MVLRIGRRRVDECLGEYPLHRHRTLILFGKTINYVLLVTHFSIFLYSACFFIQAGTLPYMSKRLGVDISMFGYLQTMFAVVQLCGGPLFGRFGDVFGGRAALTLAFASAAFSYGLMGISYTVPMLILSRLPSIFMHGMQGGQMVVTDMTVYSKRADALGKLGVSYGIGMIVGPFVGGLINSLFGENEAALVACAGSVLSMMLVRALLPATTKKNKDKCRSKCRRRHRSHGTWLMTAQCELERIVSLLRGNPRAMLLLTVKTVTGFPLGLWQSIMPMVLLDIFKLEPVEHGYLMSYAGLLVALIQGVGIGQLTRRFSDYTLIRWASMTLIWSWLLMSFVQNVWQLMVVMVPMSFGLIILNVVVSSTLTKTVPDEDTGTMLGINMAVNSLIRTVSPTIAGLMLTHFGFSSFGYIGCVSSMAVSSYLFKRIHF